jgi:hypothetical protein
VTKTIIIRELFRKDKSVYPIVLHRPPSGDPGRNKLVGEQVWLKGQTACCAMDLARLGKMMQHASNPEIEGSAQRKRKRKRKGGEYRGRERAGRYKLLFLFFFFFSTMKSFTAVYRWAFLEAGTAGWLVLNAERAVVLFGARAK